jgi:hypothetical protein
MDLLAEVTKSSKKLKQAEERYLEAMRARNEAIRAARAERFGPGKIGEAAELTPEQVRRICAAADPMPRAATRPRQKV